MKDFSHMSDLFMFQLPRKIIFGNGAIQKIGAEAAGMFAGAKKVLMVTDKGVLKAGLPEDAMASLKKSGFDVLVFDEVMPDPPIPLVLKCTNIARKEEAQIIFGIGGGSVMDAAKAVSVIAPSNGDIYECLGSNQVKKPGLSKILVPTTAGTGSEISNSFVLTDDRSGDKIASSSPYTFADLSIIDPVLTMTMPPRVTAESGMDAFSHALESFVTMRANPLSDLLSLRGIEMIFQNIRKAYTKGTHNLEARYAMCFGVCLGTMAIRSSGMGVVHATCYPPEMKYHLTHGLAISLMMPYVMEANLISNLEKYAAIASAMGEKVEELPLAEAADASIKTVRQLIKDLGLPARLREVGAKKEDFPEFARTVVSRYAYHLVNNPRNLTEEDILRIYESAW
jgi:alcohol dehydrogenase class IV